VYEALGGNSWLIADGWRPGLSCDTMHQDRWHGTECAGGSIHRLELIANNIQGTLPTEIGAMPDLRMLAIESNPLLSGTVPTEIGAMHSLRTLSIHNNTRLSGTLPSQLAVLTKLRFLSAHSGALSGTLPPEAVLRRLNYLDVSSNVISGTLPPFDQLDGYDFLNIRNNSISGTISSDVGRLSFLRDRLHLNTNRISGSLPTEIGNLTEIALPALHENSLSGSLPTELGRLTRLTFPSLSYNLFSGSLPSELSRWTTLQARLDIATNNLDLEGDQAKIDTAIARRGSTFRDLSYGFTTPNGGHYTTNTIHRAWYAIDDGTTCRWRQNPAGRSQCSMSAHERDEGWENSIFALYSEYVDSKVHGRPIGSRLYEPAVLERQGNPRWREGVMGGIPPSPPPPPPRTDGG